MQPGTSEPAREDPGPSRPRRNRAVVLLVAMAIVAAAALGVGYVLLAQPQQPYLRFTEEVNATAGTRSFTIAAVREVRGLTNYSADLRLNGSLVASLGPGFRGGMGSAQGQLRFLDMNGDGYVDVGDVFNVVAPAEGCYEFHVNEQPSGTLLASASWGACG